LILGLWTYNEPNVLLLQEGDKVAWNWGRGHAEGTVKEVHPEKVSNSSCRGVCTNP
jgi:hypothetical protein